MEHQPTISQRYRALVDRSPLHAAVFGLPALLCAGLSAYGSLEGIHWLLYRTFY